MKDRLLYLTIGVLIGIVVMQWTMPSGQATVTTPAVGNIIALIGEDVILASNGELWTFSSGGDFGWHLMGTLPVPVENVHFIDQVSPPVFGIVDKNGFLWEGYPGAWVNRGQPPVSVPASQNTWGNIKSKFE